MSGDGIPVCWLFILVLSNYMHDHSTRTNHLWMEKLGVMGVMVVGCYPSQNLYCWDLRLDQATGNDGKRKREWEQKMEKVVGRKY